MVEIEGGRPHKMLHYQSSKRPHKHRSVCMRIDVAADLAAMHSLFDQLLRRQPKAIVSVGHLAANLRQWTESLADQHVHRIAIARCRSAKIGLRCDDQGLQPMQSR